MSHPSLDNATTKGTMTYGDTEADTNSAFLQTNAGNKQAEPYFLEPPQHRLHRPLSPDTLSNLSAEEFDQLGPRNDETYGWSNSGQQTSRPSWITNGQARFRTLWIRNAGLFYMLLAQVFGVMMNVTTRLLEIEGNKGKGLHPFQVRT